MQLCKNDVNLVLIPCFKWKSTNHILQIKMVLLTLTRPELITKRKLTQTQVQLSNAHIHESTTVH